MKRQSRLTVMFFLLFFFGVQSLTAQIWAPGAAGGGETDYPSFSETDSIFVFCVDNEVMPAGELSVSTELAGTKTFLWEVYNSETASFDFYFSESLENGTSSITGLTDGCYRVTVSQGETSTVYRAWVFNSWIQAEGTVLYPSCESFALDGSFTSSEIRYHDLSTNAEVSLSRDMKVQWKEGDVVLSTVLNPELFDPPTSNVDYTLRVYDRFGCEANINVPYEPIAAKASFQVDADWTKEMTGEAPLEVTFTNTSENADPTGYEWFFYRDLNEIKEEAENGQSEIDSILLIAYDENPVYTYENTGTYMVKLVAKNFANDTLTCVDTTMMEDYIYVDPSFVEAPNVFTPNGDGTNDEFIVKFWSMKSLKISIFNRWGKRIHYWSKNDIRGFENTYVESVWNGKIGGRYASPGVYYYVVEGRGRDGESRRKNGFVHLFRGK
ncbi:T9SS type B sorting domain-containing protein [Maribellus maritimus]|uniref:T9SS type B sorting domain-containing protein n=1 Tax=Maribellus maritimus TaxID=2870838 RepID=UPI001EEBA075|nr:gliding motility-associated C-terminal domain-containing protein [Maribellus maritimus]MCG6187123.1 gliding motility-associated C-terminal domain-containing protein [Maribellus maritimus]